LGVRLIVVAAVSFHHNNRGDNQLYLTTTTYLTSFSFSATADWHAKAPHRQVNKYKHNDQVPEMLPRCHVYGHRGQSGQCVDCRCHDSQHQGGNWEAARQQNRHRKRQQQCEGNSCENRCTSFISVERVLLACSKSLPLNEASKPGGVAMGDPIMDDPELLDFPDAEAAHDRRWNR
jgi:hypothetical protein